MGETVVVYILLALILFYNLFIDFLFIALVISSDFVHLLPPFFTCDSYHWNPVVFCRWLHFKFPIIKSSKINKIHIRNAHIGSEHRSLAPYVSGVLTFHRDKISVLQACLDHSHVTKMLLNAIYIVEDPFRKKKQVISFGLILRVVLWAMDFEIELQ